MLEEALRRADAVESYRTPTPGELAAVALAKELRRVIGQLDDIVTANREAML